MKNTLAAAVALALSITAFVGGGHARDAGTARALVAARRAAEPANPPSGFNGAPSLWLEAGDHSAWMSMGSSCWSRPTGNGTAVSGCADGVAFSCTPPGNVAVSFTVAPGEPVWVHVVGGNATANVEDVSYQPLDVAATSADVEASATGVPGEWLFRAPNAGSILHVGVRSGADAAPGTGGQASFGACIRVAGDAPPDADPVDVTSTRALIRSRAQAELKWRIENDMPELPLVSSSVHCIQVLRPSLSSSRLWRCTSLSAKQGASRGMRAVGIVTQFRAPVLDRSNRTIAYMDANLARTRRFTGIAAVRGYLMEREGGGFSICAAGYVSLPPSCNGGGVRVRSLDADAYHLDSFGSRRYSREEVVVIGRLAQHILTADP